MVKSALFPFPRSPSPVLAFALLLALPVGTALAAPASADLVSESVDRLGLQTELPGPNMGPRLPDLNIELRSGGSERNLPPGPEMPVPGQRPQAEMPEPKSEPPAKMPDPAAAPARAAPAADASTWLRLMLWGAVILGTLVIVWSLRGSLPVIGRSRRIIAPERAASAAPSKRMAEAQLEADDLARQGRYGEAMHMLLLNSLGEVRRQLETSFAVSLTSREILRRVHLPDHGRQSLTAIIRSVERTYFGGADAGQGDYASCRSHFETLKHSLATIAAR